MATMAMVAIPSQLFALGGNVDALILLIGLAVGVDYSLFYMRREREERAAGRSTRDALEVAAATSGRAVMISGLTVTIAMAGMFITGDATFISFAVATVTVVPVAMFATLAVLPAVLAWLGDRVEKGRIPFSQPSSRRGRGVALLERDRHPRDAPAGRLDRRRRRPPGRPGDPGARHERGPDRYRRPAQRPAGDADV